MKSGLPGIKLPPFSTKVGDNELTFFQMCTELSASIVLVPVIAVLGNVAIAKAFGKVDIEIVSLVRCALRKLTLSRRYFSRNAASGDTIDATQELYALGICNTLGSFVSSMPVTGSFSRSAVNHVSGVRTPIGGLYTGTCEFQVTWTSRSESFCFV